MSKCDEGDVSGKLTQLCELDAKRQKQLIGSKIGDTITEQSKMFKILTTGITQKRGTLIWGVPVCVG